MIANFIDLSCPDTGEIIAPMPTTFHSQHLVIKMTVGKAIDYLAKWICDEEKYMKSRELLIKHYKRTANVPLPGHEKARRVRGAMLHTLQLKHQRKMVAFLREKHERLNALPTNEICEVLH